MLRVLLAAAAPRLGGQECTTVLIRQGAVPQGGHLGGRRLAILHIVETEKGFWHFDWAGHKDIAPGDFTVGFFKVVVDGATERRGAAKLHKFGLSRGCG